MNRLLVFLFCLAVTGLVFQCQVRSDVASPLCYWVTQNEVLVWRSADDDQPTSGRFNPETGLWAIAPGGPEGGWRPILEHVAKSYVKEVNVEQVRDDQLWGFALAKLRNEFNTGGGWARPRKPSTEIYLLPSSEKMEVTFIPETGGAPERVNATFTRNSNGIWKKQGGLDLKKLLGVPDDPKELRKVFNLGQGSPASTVTQDWEIAWDNWIKNSPEAGSVRHVMYRDNQGQLRWLWYERLTPGAQLPTTLRQPPPPPAKITEPSLSTTAPPLPPGNPQSPIPTIIVWAMVPLALLGAYFFGGYLFAAFLWLVRWLVRRLGELLLRALTWLEKKLAKALDREERKPIGITEENLNVIHQYAVEQLRQRFAEDEAVGRVLNESLELARHHYIAAAQSKGLIREADSYRASIITEYCQKDLGVAAEDSGKIRTWVDLGRATEPALAQVSSLGIPEEVEDQLGREKAVKSWSESSWVTEWPRVLTALRARVSESKKTAEGLRQQLAGQATAHSKDLQDQNERITSVWQGRVTGLETEAAKQREYITRTQTTLENTQEKVRELEQHVKMLNGELSGMRSALDSAQAGGSEMERKIRELYIVRQLSRGLRRWLQGYYFDHNSDSQGSGETRSVAVIATLINFSLCQMCFSIVEDLHNLREAVAHNILLLTRTFDQLEGEQFDFSHTYAYLNQIVPQIENPAKKMKQGQRPGDTLDVPLFRGLLYWLQTDTGKNLSPFFVDRDNEDSTLAFVSVS